MYSTILQFTNVIECHCMSQFSLLSFFLSLNCFYNYKMVYSVNLTSKLPPVSKCLRLVEFDHTT